MESERTMPNQQPHYAGEITACKKPRGGGRDRELLDFSEARNLSGGTWIPLKSRIASVPPNFHHKGQFQHLLKR